MIALSDKTPVTTSSLGLEASAPGTAQLRSVMLKR
jgi:hypothetical protein